MRTVDITSKGQMYTAPFENHKIGTGAISMFRPSTNLFLHRQSEEKRLHNLLKRTKRRTGLGCERCANVRHDNECPRLLSASFVVGNTTFGMSLYGYAYIWMRPLGRVWCRMRPTLYRWNEKENVCISCLLLRTRLLLKQGNDNPFLSSSFLRANVRGGGKKRKKKGKTWRGLAL